MDNMTEKRAKVTDLGTYTDLTPEHLKKLFKDTGGSPEKLRTILNLWFVPNFKPTFIEPQNYAFNGLQDVDFLETPNMEHSRPMRLIDLETGNLVDAWNTDPSDPYCMLSHRWKGDEITLAHIKRAQQMHFERTKEGHVTKKDDDMSLVLEQAKLDVIEQEETIKLLLGSNSEGKTVEDLLDMRINASDAKAKANWARQDRDAKKAKLDRCRMEKGMFDNVINRVYQDEELALVGKAEEEYAEAQTTLNTAIEIREQTRSQAQFLNNKGRLSDAVDEMIGRLQRWKSALKLTNSISSARNIFKTNIFPNQGSRYIWSDTCCIDKLNYGELSQSLSLMGDWYANAEFCIVHLDTDWQVGAAVKDWKEFKGEGDGEVLGIPTFKEIADAKPEWSNRAWTLQELVMSKMVYFFNAEWKALSRPVESLGYTYPLIPFVELYTRGNIANVFKEPSATKAETFTLSQMITNAEKVGPLLNEDDIVISGGGDEQATKSVKLAVRLVLILHGIGFRFPAEMTMETAMSEMTREVYLAAWNIAKNKDDPKCTLIHLLMQKEPDLTEHFSQEEFAQFINFLLVCLVKVT
ncbi:unnamed protein product, partial [Fusarium langsethiae]